MAPGEIIFWPISVDYTFSISVLHEMLYRIVLKKESLALIHLCITCISQMFFRLSSRESSNMIMFALTLLYFYL